MGISLCIFIGDRRYRQLIMEKISCVLLALAALAALAQAQNEEVLVTLSKGQVKGYSMNFREPRTTNTDRRLNVFKGIPFAEPPMRFKPPVEKRPWEGVYDATFFRYACLQGYLPAEFMSEDCLTLNIWAPAVRENENERLPVMVNFHSGDFQYGAGSTDFNDGAPMAAINDVVVVTFNYRLGIFGFGSSDSELVPGNMGLMDQAMAMRWVRENIEAFGGNSEQVTVYGSLAGAASISLHMVSPISRDLFDRAILQGGSFYAYWAFSENSTEEAIKAVELATRLGCRIDMENEPEMDVLTCLTLADPQRVIQVAIAMGFEGRTFLPTIDGRFIPEAPAAMLDRGDFKRCPIIGGFNRDSGTRDIMYITQTENSPTPPRLSEEEFFFVFQVSRIAASMNEGIQTALSEAGAQEYLDYSKYFQRDYDYFTSASEVHGDAGYACPTFNFTWTWATQNITEPVYIYQMSYAPAVSIYQLYNVTQARWLGATLEEDLLFTVGMAFVPELVAQGFNPPDRERELSVQFMKYWSNFAKTGNPNLPDLFTPGLVGSPYLTWPTYTAEYQYNLDLANEVTVGEGLKSNKCYLWNYMLPNLRRYLNTLVYERREGGDGVGAEWREQFADWQRYNEEWKMAFEQYQNNENTCN